MSKKPKTSKCPSCPADIYWATNVVTGKLMPVDVAIVAGGNVILTVNKETGAIKCDVLGKGEDPAGRPTRLHHKLSCTNPPPKKKKGWHSGGTPG
jgi:hypothetical protein